MLRVKDILDESDKRLRMVSKDVVFPLTKKDRETIDLMLEYLYVGDYGKEITLDGQKYINYYVPSGKYKITNNGKWCTVYVAKDEYYKNSDGYMENKIVDTVEFSKNGETKTISVKKGEHIELTVHATISLELVQ